MITLEVSQIGFNYSKNSSINWTLVEGIERNSVREFFERKLTIDSFEDKMKYIVQGAYL